MSLNSTPESSTEEASCWFVIVAYGGVIMLWGSSSGWIGASPRGGGGGLTAGFVSPRGLRAGIPDHCAILFSRDP